MRKAVRAADFINGSSFKLDVEPGPIKGFLMSEGASLRFVTVDDTVVLASGRGHLVFDFVADQPGQLVVQADSDECANSLCIPSLRDGVVGWRDGPSFAQLELKSRDTVSPEVRAALDKMERNMRVREALLMAALERSR